MPEHVGSHVKRGANKGLVIIVFVDVLLYQSKAKVNELDLEGLRVDEYVLRLDVAVSNSRIPQRTHRVNLDIEP